MPEKYWITSTVLPIALVVIMTGLGMGLVKDDFIRILKLPKAMAVGLCVQMFILPSAALLLAHTFQLRPEFAVGLMILSASPGGVAANLFSHLGNGDVALNLSLTAVNSILASIWLPLVTAFSLTHFAGPAGHSEIGLQTKKAIEVFFLVVVPCAIGMTIRRFKPKFAQGAQPFIKKLSFAVLIAIAVLAILKEKEALASNALEVGPTVLIFNLLSLGLGYIIPRALKLNLPQSIAIAFEIGIHNSTLAFYMALTVLGEFNYVIPAALYSVVMFVTAGFFLRFIKSQNTT